MSHLPMRTSPFLVPVEYGESAAGPDGRMTRLLSQLHTAQLSGQPHELYEAWLEAARGWVEMGAYGAAEAHFEQALRWSHLLGAADATVQLLCEVAELNAVHAERREREQRGAGRSEMRRARAYAQEAARRAGDVADPAWEVTVLLRVSDVLDRCGRHNEALELQVRAVRLMAERSQA
jgi:tetratricopeptide (TPR) repeat protein